MIFNSSLLAGVFEIVPEMLSDERGFFARVYCQKEFRAVGLSSELDWAQCSISFNTHKYTLRGMHYQNAPYGEHKLVRCTMGRVYDVALDLRQNSPTRYRWHAVELSAENRVSLLLCPGIAHGFLTLEDNCEIFYQIKEPYQANVACGVRWDDPKFGIAWPVRPKLMSKRDAEFNLISDFA